MLPNFINEENHVGFISRTYGVNFIASLKDYGALQCIHVSLTPIRSLRPNWSDKYHEEYMMANASDIVQTFMGNRKFARQPDDARRPSMRHYFSVLGENE